MLYPVSYHSSHSTHHTTAHLTTTHHRLRIKHHSSHTTDPTALISHNSYLTSHSIPFISHHSAETIHLTPFISHHLSNSAYLPPLLSQHSSYATPLPPIIPQHSNMHYSCYATQLIPSAFSGKRRKTSHVVLSGPFIVWPTSLGVGCRSKFPVFINFLAAKCTRGQFIEDDAVMKCHLHPAKKKTKT